ncbi:MAG: hypothetical protein JNL57_13110 [Bacteroidetes bacterium]|nr:hypothetical protein [Bacteroidota bacterium]
MFFLASYTCTSAQEKEPLVNTGDSVLVCGFWNVENLFDTRNDAWNDDDFTPAGKLNWTTKRYKNKLEHTARVIHAMDADILGLCELESAAVLKDLLAESELKNKGYAFVHYDSPDERGIDAGVIYRSAVCDVLNSQAIAVTLDAGDKTRDILYTQFKLKKTGDTLHVFVNHWPSRREGEAISEPKRCTAARTLQQFISSRRLESRAVLICGDLNDNPWDSSVRHVLNSARPGKNTTATLLNLTALLNVREGGSLRHNGRWDLFDQMIVSRSLWDSAAAPFIHFMHYSHVVFSPQWMRVAEGKQKGSPLRTFSGNTYLNGYSDHFPVLAKFNYER